MDKWRAVFRTPGFVEAPRAEAARAVREQLTASWQTYVKHQYGEGTSRGDIVAFEIRTLDAATLEDALASLDPLVGPIPTRHLFVSTNSTWTAYFTNAFRGGSEGTVEQGASRILQTRALKVVSSDDVSHSYAQILRVYVKGVETRAIELVQEEEGKYLFRQAGNPLPFEDVEAYVRGKGRARFSRTTLVQHLAALDVRPFDDQFYEVTAPESAHLVERVDRDPKIRRRFRPIPVSKARY